jgi:hypothetical protein
LLVLDEPLASLDPLARHDFMASLMAAVAENGLSVVLSSHVIADLERVADYLIVLSHGQVQAAGEVEGLLAGHSALTGPAAAADDVAERLAVVHASRAGTVAHLLVRNGTAEEPVPSGWEAHPVGLEEAAPGGAGRGGRAARRPWSLYLLIMGLKIRSGYASVASCHPASSAACGLASDLFLRDYYPTAQTFTGFLEVIPGLAGVFAGGPVLARELETGTFRFAWTQGCGRLRWVIAKLALLAIAVTAAAEAFSLLFSWYFHPKIDPYLAKTLPSMGALLKNYFAPRDFVAGALRC